MTYNILLITNENDSCIECTKRTIDGLGEKCAKNFAYENCFIDSDITEIVKKAKSAHAVILGTGVSKSSIRRLCAELGLHTQVRNIEYYQIINDAFGGIYSAEKGYRNNPAFGREAFDTECYSELEIERVARVAYELSPTRHVTLADKADELATSKLWRKIVTDINEDYPYVNVDMLSVEDTIEVIANNPLCPETLLTSHMFGDIIYSLANAKSNGAKYYAFVGDTTLGMYGCDANQDVRRGIIYAVAFMLRHSFDMQDEADRLILSLS